MSRPKVPDERVERLEEIVDKETQLPASALTFAEQLEYLLDMYVGRKRRGERLDERVEELKRELEEKRSSSSSTSSGPGGRSSGSFGP